MVMLESRLPVECSISAFLLLLKNGLTMTLAGRVDLVTFLLFSSTGRIASGFIAFALESLLFSFSCIFGTRFFISPDDVMVF